MCCDRLLRRENVHLTFKCARVGEKQLPRCFAGPFGVLIRDGVGPGRFEHG